MVKKNTKHLFKGSYILVCIDGTGSHDWSNGTNSYVKSFHDDFNSIRKKYYHGVGERVGGEVLGTGAKELVDKSCHFISIHITQILKVNLSNSFLALDKESKRRRRSEILKKIRICLIGHSRGGLATILIAQKLPVPVYFMGLYDAVDMYNEFLADSVNFKKEVDPSTIHNVDYTYHAMRSPDLGSRKSWGNCGIKSSGKYSEQVFKTSHGGMGGDVVTKPRGFSADYTCSSKGVRAGAMRLQGLNITKMCISQSKTADIYIRSGAKARGLPLRK